MNACATFTTKLLATALILGLGTAAQATPLINGDFEAGNLNGWTTFTTVNGTLGTGFPNVVSFDTNNDSVATNSAQFRVGQVSFQSGVYGGGGIYQMVSLGAGSLSISADIAALGGPVVSNLSGGLFELLLDGVLLDSHDFGRILATSPNSARSTP